MFRIGEFSRLAQVSSRLLRHYEQLGLFRPAVVDEDSGYRFYRASQLAELNRILVLKDLGFSLEQVGEMVRDELSAEQLRQLLTLRRAEVERDIDVQSLRLRRLEHRIADLDGGADDEDVLFRAVPAALVLSARFTCRSFEEARHFVDEVHLEVPRRFGRTRVDRIVVLQHAPEYEPDELDLEIGWILAEGAEVDALDVAGHRMSVRELPAIETAAICVRVGPPHEAHRHTRAIARRLEDEGFILNGANREVFLRAPSAKEPPVVEMQFPVRRA
ncbi:MAG: MerR family transcriptional regulator [Polyangiaceae bacterium]